jgi:hypothetical protein
MALGRRKTWPEYNIGLHPEMQADIKQRAADLGYSTLAQFIRCLIRTELREHNMPRCRELLGRNPRKASLMRPRDKAHQEPDR